MNKKVILSLVMVPLLMIASGCSMKSAMVDERVSPYGLEQTIETIVSNAKALGWSSPAVRNMNKSIAKHGGPDIGGAVRIVELCNASHASRILMQDDGRFASVLMPCAISVYEKSDGKVYVTNMRAGRMGGMMGGIVAEVMAEVDEDQQKMLAFLNH